MRARHLKKRLDKIFLRDFADADLKFLSKEELCWKIAAEVSYEYRDHPVPLEEWRSEHRKRWFALHAKCPPKRQSSSDPVPTEEDLKQTARFYDHLWSLNKNRKPGDLLPWTTIWEMSDPTYALPCKLRTRRGSASKE